MDATTTTQLIGSLGFPIACCVYLIYTMNAANKAHSEDLDKLRETVENNTKVMTKICAKLGLEED